MAFFSTSAGVKTSRGGHKQFLFVLMFMHLEIHIKSIFGSSSTFLCTVMVSSLHPPKMEEKKRKITHFQSPIANKVINFCPSFLAFFNVKTLTNIKRD